MTRPIQLLRIFGLAMCLLSAGFSAAELLGNRALDRTAGCLVEAVCRMAGLPAMAVAALEVGTVALFGVVFWKATRRAALLRPSRGVLRLLVVQSMLAMVTAPELLVLVSVEVALLLEVRLGLWCISGQAALQVAAIGLQWGLTGGHPMLKLMDYGPGKVWISFALMSLTSIVWHYLAFSLGLLGAVANRRSRELVRVNAELRASRLLEAETARLTERLSLSRELHDASGHHLAALSVNLRLMRHLTDPEELQVKLDESLIVVQNLLGEVREVVRDLRGLQAINLRAALETLAAGLPELHVHLSMDEELRAAEPFHAHTLFRCCQELMTNTVKHAEAANLWLTIRRRGDGFHLEAHDDGRGAASFTFGNGLTGMRDRALDLGGSFQARSREGAGFAVELVLPVRSRAA